jgi:hypothetical protein
MIAWYSMHVVEAAGRQAESLVEGGRVWSGFLINDWIVFLEKTFELFLLGFFSLFWLFLHYLWVLAWFLLGIFLLDDGGSVLCVFRMGES